MPDDTPEKLAWSLDNLDIVLERLLTAAAADADGRLRQALLDPQTAKNMIAAEIQTPDDWEQRFFGFQERAVLDSRFLIGALPAVGEGVDLDVHMLCSWRVPR